MSHKIELKNNSDVPFNVVFVESGETYGSNDNIVNNGQTLVEFHDSRFVKSGKHGLFVVRYTLETILSLVSGINFGSFEYFLEKEAVLALQEHINNFYKRVDSYA